jgi:hypothetical protein
VIAYNVLEGFNPIEMETQKENKKEEEFNYFI